jgi:hypothetical protein
LAIEKSNRVEERIRLDRRARGTWREVERRPGEAKEAREEGRKERQGEEGQKDRVEEQKNGRAEGQKGGSRREGWRSSCNIPSASLRVLSDP